MKKKFCLLLALLLTALPIAAQGEPFILIDDESACIYLEVTSVEMSDTSLRYFVVVENQSERDLDFCFEDARADGAEVRGIGLFDIEDGERTDDFFFFRPLEGDDMSVLENAERISCTIVLKDSHSGDEALRIPVTLSTETFEEERPTTTARPRSTPEPQILLTIPDGSYGEWEYLSSDTLRMRVTVKNTSAARAVEAFEIYMYATDVWGDPIYGEDYVYYETTEKLVEPFESTFSAWVRMPRSDDLSRIYAGIHRVRYDNGEIVEASPVAYSYWDID